MPYPFSDDPIGGWSEEQLENYINDHLPKAQISEDRYAFPLQWDAELTTARFVSPWDVTLVGRTVIKNQLAEVVDDDITLDMKLNDVVCNIPSASVPLVIKKDDLIEVHCSTFPVGTTSIATTLFS